MNNSESQDNNQLQPSNRDDASAGVILMTEVEARACVSQIKNCAEKLHMLFLDMYEREGWRALNYKSWIAWALAEFDYKRTHLYEFLTMGKVERNINTPPTGTPESAIADSPASSRMSDIPLTQSQAEVLAHLPPAQQRVVWERAIETVGAGRLTADFLTSVVKEIVPLSEQPAKFNSKRDTPSMHKADEPTATGYTVRQPPAFVLDPLLPFLRSHWTIWEPVGSGLLVAALYGNDIKSVIAGDIHADYSFFEEEPKRWDCIVTTPPFYLAFEWLQRCYELTEPFALLLPVETLGEQRIQYLFDEQGIEIIVVDKHVSFKVGDNWTDEDAPHGVAWFTWRLNIDQQLMFTKIDPRWNVAF